MSCITVLQANTKFLEALTVTDSGSQKEAKKSLEAIYSMLDIGMVKFENYVDSLDNVNVVFPLYKTYSKAVMDEDPFF